MKKHSTTVHSVTAQAGQACKIIAIAALLGTLAPPVQAERVEIESILKGASQIDNFSNASPGAILVSKSTKKSDKSSSKNQTKDDKSENKAEAKPTPLPPIENVVNVTTDQLVDKPQDFLNKNVKFTAKFFMYSSLALDYKPAMRSSRTNLSFLVLRPEAHIPYAEIKLAMALPKEKDPETLVLASLKDGDQIEVIGKVFATPLDEPWIDVLRLKKLASDEKKDDKKLSANETEATKKEHAPELDGTVKGKMLPDKGSAFPPDTGTKDSKIVPDRINPPSIDTPVNPK